MTIFVFFLFFIFIQKSKRKKEKSDCVEVLVATESGSNRWNALNQKSWFAVLQGLACCCWFIVAALLRLSLPNPEAKESEMWGSLSPLSDRANDPESTPGSVRRGTGLAKLCTRQSQRHSIPRRPLCSSKSPPQRRLDITKTR